MTYRSFLRRPGVSEAFPLCRNEAATDGAADMRPSLARLSRQLYLPHAWTTPLADPADGLEPWENPLIPSAYTYLGQFIAHDLAHSNMLTAALGAHAAAPRNARANPLTLETLYGAGLDGCALAWDGSPRARGASAARLPLARTQDTRTVQGQCPFADLPRLKGENQAHLGNVAIADDRNDNNAIVAQLTVLFTLLHNSIADELESRLDCELPPATRRAILFADSRAITTDIYRRIIRHDWLPRILHPDIDRRYQGSNVRFLDHGAGVPLEAVICLRFGHAMVRPRYRINACYGRQEELIDVLLTTSRGRPWRMPIDESWVLNWSLFADLGSAPANLSRRIGPEFSSALMSASVFEAVDDLQTAGLAYRDVLQCAGGPIWSVTPLIEEISRRRPGLLAASRLASDRGLRRSLIRAWLEGGRAFTGLSRQEIEAFSADPPLLVYVLLEAAEECAGAHLGHLGSILLAEAIGRHLAGAEVPAHRESDLVGGPARLRGAGLDRYFAQRDVLAETLGSIRTLPGMIGHVATWAARSEPALALA